MDEQTEQNSANIFTNPVAITLINLKEKIIEEWIHEVVRNIPTAAKLQTPIIVNTLPALLRNLAEAIDGNFPRLTANDANNIAEEHGGERARMTNYSPEQVILEYNLLRDIVLSKLHQTCEMDYRSYSLILKSFDESIQKSMIAYYLIFNEIRENLIVHLTHDMRTPLTAAKLSLDIILKKLNLSPGTIQDNSFGKLTPINLEYLVNKVKKNIEYSNELIQGILDENYLKSYKAGIKGTFIKAEFKSIIREALSELSDNILNHIELKGEAIDGYCDVKAFRRVIENLVSNAIKYGFEDTPIVISLSKKFSRVIITVHNIGNPVPVEDRELLFKMFQRTDASNISKKEGWGLGLAYCREVIEAHGGSLGIESSLELGTTLTIDIPEDPRDLKTRDS
jgi:signal transduction histidine kinase